ncbi:hypothetical protein A2U01_0054764, partial [Trifolium medium]|nr:hypothetical protein [Trifolium medium]
MSKRAADIPSPLRPGKSVTNAEVSAALKEFLVSPATKPWKTKSSDVMF